MTTETSAPHLRSVVLALVLIVLEHSDVLAQLSITLYDGLVKGRAPRPEWVYEISMVWLAVGTCIVIFVSSLAKDRNRSDDWTIATGVLAATVLAVFSVLDAWLNDEDVQASVVLLQVLFFWGVWVLLILFPLLLALVRGAALLGSGVIATALCLVVAVVLSVPYRWITAEVLWRVVKAGQATSANGAFDRLIYNADSLLILGATWSMAAFAPGRGRSWRIFYVIACACAAAAYPLLFDKPSDWPAPYPLVVSGFVALSLAGLLPMAVATGRVWAGKLGATLGAMCATFVTCGAAMAATLGRVWDTSVQEFVALALVQAGAGALIPLAVYVAGRIAARAGSTRKAET